MGKVDNYKQRTARNTIKQRPISQELNYYDILESFSDIQEACADIRWMDDAVEDAIGEEMADTFRMQFADLCADCERFGDELRDYRYAWTLDDGDKGASYFDALWAASGGSGTMAWFDEDEREFESIYGWTESYARKVAETRIEKLTKAKILELVGDSIWLVRSYVAIRYRYQMLSGVFDLIRERGGELLKTVKGIEDKWQSWNEARKTGDQAETERELDKALAGLPDRVWVE